MVFRTCYYPPLGAPKNKVEELKKQGGAYNQIENEEKEKQKNMSIKNVVIPSQQPKQSNNSNNKISQEKLKKFVNFKFL